MSEQGRPKEMSPQQKASRISNTLLWLHSKKHDDHSTTGAYREEWEAMGRLFFPQAEKPGKMLEALVHPMFGRED